MFIRTNADITNVYKEVDVLSLSPLNFDSYSIDYTHIYWYIYIYFKHNEFIFLYFVSYLEFST